MSNSLFHAKAAAVWHVQTRTSGLRRMLTSVLTISERHAAFGARGLERGAPHKLERFETIGRTFIAGYNAGIECPLTEDIALQLDRVESELRGFAYEGAAMALTLLDHLLPGKNRFTTFLAGAGEPHTYMLHVGAGWAIARLPWLRFRLKRSIAQYDPVLRSLAVDGFGFHEGYFSWVQTGEKQRVPRAVTGDARRAFDLGLGRSLWFACCGDTDRVCDTVARFATTRQTDLWSGIGLAVTYAGAASEHDLLALRAAAAEQLPAMAQGAAFAAKARMRAGNPATHTERACLAFCGMPAREAAAVTDSALANLPGENCFQVWRERIQREFSGVRRSYE